MKISQLNLLLDTKTLKKSIGYSYFPKEICPTPVAWARKLGDMVFHKEHDKVIFFFLNRFFFFHIYFVIGMDGWMDGLTFRLIFQGGHFAALEQPQLFMEDLEAFVAAAWK